MNIRQNLFGQGPKAGYGRAPAPPPRDDAQMGGGYDDPRGSYGSQAQPPRGSYGSSAPPPRQAVPQRTAVGRGPASPARRLELSIAKVEDKTLANQYIFGNM